MRYALNLTTVPASEPITLDEAKKQIEISSSVDADDDTYIEGLITTAREWAEDHTDRGFINQSWTYNVDWWPRNGIIKLNRGPVSSVTSLKYKDTDGDQQTLVEGTDFQVDLVSEPARILPEPGATWPTLEADRVNAVEVIFVVGYGATAASVREDVKHAIKLMVADWYEHREDASDGKVPKSIPRGAEQILSHVVMPLI